MHSRTCSPKPRWPIWTIWWGLENQVSNMTYLAVSLVFKALIKQLDNHISPLDLAIIALDAIGCYALVDLLLSRPGWHSDVLEDKKVMKRLGQRRIHQSSTYGHHPKALLCHQNVVKYFGSQPAFLYPVLVVDESSKTKQSARCQRSDLSDDHYWMIFSAGQNSEEASWYVGFYESIVVLWRSEVHLPDFPCCIVHTCPWKHIIEDVWKDRPKWDSFDLVEPTSTREVYNFQSWRTFQQNENLGFVFGNVTMVTRHKVVIKPSFVWYWWCCSWIGAQANSVLCFLLAKLLNFS